MPRSDHRVLSSERSGPVHKPSSLELSLLQPKDYLHALGGLRVLLVVAGVAWSLKRLWDDISPYSIVSIHVAFHQRLEGIVACLPNIVLLNVQKSSTFLTISFLLYEAFAPILDSLHLLPQPGKPPRLDSLSEHSYLLPLNSWLCTGIIVWLTLSLWSYCLGWDCFVFILLWLCWLLFLLVSLFFLNLKCMLFSFPECVSTFACCFLF